MAAAAAAAATPPWCGPRRCSDGERTAASVTFPLPMVGTALLLRTRRSASSPTRASDPHRQPEEEDSITAEDDNTTTTTNISQEEDVRYVWRLGAGSVTAAAVIKYGSIAFPEMTRPNIWVALAMVTAPVVVAVFLLINQSLRQEQ